MEKRDDETITAFTLRRIRDEIIEECAQVAEGAIPDIQKYNSVSETVGAHIAARRIRALRSETSG